MFSPEALKFLRDLERNNRREWFQPRKENFDAVVRAPMLAMVEKINAELAKFAPEYIADPKKAVYRIYRDVRFSADKSPYKTHQAAIFKRRGASPGFYFSISAKEVGIAGGVYEPTPEQMLAVRNWLAENHEPFRKLVKKPEKLMGALHGESLTRTPKGFAADHPAADLLKMKRWIFYATLDSGVALTPKLAPELIKRFKAMHPALEELSKALGKSRSRAAMLADF